MPNNNILELQKERFGALIKQGFLKCITTQEAIEDSARRMKELAPQDWVTKISPRPLLLIGGEEDATVNPDRIRFLFAKAKQPKKLVIIKDTDHVFTNKRRELVRRVTNWLKSQVQTD
ncbi:MAG: Peptidase protein [Thermoproteota archaeon]|nr:Peptidase protein [Thermoproteota archaeon]